MNLPADVANLALDNAGVDMTLGDLQEGTREAQVTLRAYGRCLRQLLRAAHWDFARFQSPMVLLGDRTGQTANVGNMVPVPWTYCYAYPIDCMKARFIPWNSGQTPAVPPTNIQIPDVPLTTGSGQAPYTGLRLKPSRFLVATDSNYPPDPQQVYWETQGESPQSRTVILSNVKDAQIIYTRLMLYPSNWDVLFYSAMVAYLASEIAMPLAKDKKFGMSLRDSNIKIAAAKIKEARVLDGNEGTYSSDIAVDWMAFRNSGGGRGWGGSDGDPGVLGYGWDNCVFSDGTAY